MASFQTVTERLMKNFFDSGCLLKKTTQQSLG